MIPKLILSCGKTCLNTLIFLKEKKKEADRHFLVQESAGIIISSILIQAMSYFIAWYRTWDIQEHNLLSTINTMTIIFCFLFMKWSRKSILMSKTILWQVLHEFLTRKTQALTNYFKFSKYCKLLGSSLFPRSLQTNYYLVIASIFLQFHIIHCHIIHTGQFIPYLPEHSIYIPN